MGIRGGQSGSGKQARERIRWRNEIEATFRLKLEKYVT